MIKVENKGDGVAVAITGSGRDVASELFGLVNGLLSTDGRMKELTDRTLEVIAMIILDKRMSTDEKKEVLHVMSSMTAIGTEEDFDKARKIMKEQSEEKEELWN